MPLNKLSDREGRLLVMTIALVIFYVFYQFLFSPKWDELSALKARAQKVRSDLRVAEEKIKILDSMSRDLVALPEKEGVPREARALEVLRALAQAISNSNLNLSRIKPIINEEKGIKFELSCTGSYYNLYSFLRILRRLGVVVIFDALEVSGGGSRNPTLFMKMVLTAYY